MKKTLLILLGFLLGTAVAIGVVTNPFHWQWLHPLQHRIAESLAGGAAPADEGQLWTCSMHPQVIETEPGTCPICQMALTPVRGSAPAGASAATASGTDPDTGLVSIDPRFVQNMGVRTAPVTRDDIPMSIRTVATLSYDDSQVAVVTTRYEGWVENVYAVYVGESVRKGQTLFDLYSPDLVATQKEYLDALAYSRRIAAGPHAEAADRADSLVDSIRQRLAYWDVSDAQLAALRQRGEPQRSLPVRAPVSGIIISKAGRSLEGQHVRPGMNLYEIADLTTIWAEADVFEHQIPWVRVGQRATVEFPAGPLGARTGTVRYLAPAVDADTRTLRASIELPNPDLRLRADMVADVTFRVPSASGVLTVPEEAVILSGRRNIVIVDRGEGRFEPREVSVGVQGDGRWEITDGLAEGESVVVSSQFLIDSESNLREAVRKMASGQTALPTHQH